jgi:hypothetical protein
MQHGRLDSVLEKFDAGESNVLDISLVRKFTNCLNITV